MPLPTIKEKSVGGALVQCIRESINLYLKRSRRRVHVAVSNRYEDLNAIRPKQGQESSNEDQAFGPNTKLTRTSSTVPTCVTTLGSTFQEKEGECSDFLGSSSLNTNPHVG